LSSERLTFFLNRNLHFRTSIATSGKRRTHISCNCWNGRNSSPTSLRSICRIKSFC